jgi:hypothetical protein
VLIGGSDGNEMSKEWSCLSKKRGGKEGKGKEAKKKE